MTKWISVKDRLPNYDERVLGYSPINEEIRTCILHNDHGRAWWFAGHHEDYDFITHWMPLPEAPKEEE